MLESNEIFIKYSKKCNLFNLVMILKAAKITNCLPALLNENFQHFSKNIKDNYSLINLIFIKDISSIKFFEVENGSFGQIIEQASEEDEKNKISMNLSKISLKIDANAEISMISNNEKEEIISQEAIKMRNKITEGSELDFKKALNFNEDVLEALINFFKIVCAYSASLLRYRIS